MITDERCAMVDHIIVASGAAETFDQHLRGPGGPKPKFPRSLYLIGWLLAVLTYQKSHIRLIHRILTKEVPMEWQHKWGIRWTVESDNGSSEWRILTEESLQEISKRVRALYNYTTNFIEDEPARGIFRGDIRLANEAALNTLVDALIRGTLPAPRTTRWTRPGCGPPSEVDVRCRLPRICSRASGTVPTSTTAQTGLPTAMETPTPQRRSGGGGSAGVRMRHSVSRRRRAVRRSRISAINSTRPFG